MDTLGQDLRHALRGFRGNPVLTLAAVVSLALGIGANTTVFTFLHALFLKPLPVAEPSRLVALHSLDRENPGLLPVSYPNFVDLAATSAAFDGLAAHRWARLSLTLGDGAQQVFGEVVSANYFDVIGVRAARGRTFLPEEGASSGGRPVVVLSHVLWQREFAGDPDLVGRTIEINGLGFTVVGIAPEGFRGLSLWSSPKLWLPLEVRDRVLPPSLVRFFERRDGLLLQVVGRLRPGVSLAQGQAAVDARIRRLVADYPEANQGLGAALTPLLDTVLPVQSRHLYILAGWLLAGVVAVLLLITCANVANLLLARAVARRREMAVRLALGAGRRRLLRQLLTEAMVLALAGGAAALVIAVAGRRILWALRPPFFPADLDLGFNPAVLGLTLAVAVATGCACGLAPALLSFRVDLISELKDRAGDLRQRPGRLRPGALLVAAQVTLSVTLLAGAGLFLRSLGNYQRIDPGFATARLFLLHLDLTAQGYGEAEGLAFFDRARERVESLAGVVRAAFTSQVMLGPGGARTSVTVAGQERRGDVEGVLVPYSQVSEGYFDTFGIPLQEGRAFTPGDHRDAPSVAVINRTMARWLWPDGEALGRRFTLEGGAAATEVVGVVADAKYGSLGEEPQPHLYLPWRQNFSPMMFLHVRTVGEPEPLMTAVRQEIHALNPSLPLSAAEPVSRLVADALWAPRMLAGLLGLVGLLALALSAVGIYGVLAYSVRQRGREIGVRMALGARRGQVVGMILGQGMAMVGAGGLAGLLLAVALSPLVSDLLFQLRATDPLALASAVLVLAAVALVASGLPAWRSASIDPVRALREE